MEVTTEKKIAPMLRFNEYVEKWNKKKLGDLGNFIGGGTPSTINPNYWKGTIPWISSSDIIENDIHNINITRYINESAINESATKIIPKKSVLLISRVGVGKLAVNDVEVCTSQDFSNFIPEKCNSYFIGYLLSSKKNRLISFSQGTSIKGFTTSDIKTFLINLPTLPEQQKIASFLSAVDKKIEQLTQKKSLLETYKKGVMQKIFTSPPLGGDAAGRGGELRFKQDDGSNYPDWEEKKLGEIIHFGNGKGHEKYISSDGEFIVVNSKFISSNGIVKKYTDNQICPLKKGDIVMVMSDVPKGKALAKCYFIDEDYKYTLNQRICALKPNNNDTRFLFYLINRNKYFLSFDSGVGQTNLRKDEVLNCPLTIPNSIEEQQKIALFLSAIDKKIELVNTQLEQTKVFKKGLLQQMFV